MTRHTGVVIDPFELDDLWVRRIEDGRIHVLGLHPDPKNSSPEQILAWLEDANTRRWLDALTALGVQIEWEVHALSWLLPRKLFRTNPQWFRMDEAGERTPDHNLCCSSEDALEVIRANAARYALLLKPTNHRHHFWLDDVSNCRCHCPQCKTLSAADQALKVYNAIAQGVRRSDPMALQCYLAYHDTNAVPQKVLPEPGIFLEYAPFERDHRMALNDPLCHRNAAEKKNLPELLHFFGLAGAQVLDYWLDNSLFSGWTKPPREFKMERDVFRQDVQYYRQLGFTHITTFACYLGREYTAIYPEPEDPVFYGRALSVHN